VDAADRQCLALQARHDTVGKVEKDVVKCLELMKEIESEVGAGVGFEGLRVGWAALAGAGPQRSAAPAALAPAPRLGRPLTRARRRRAPRRRAAPPGGAQEGGEPAREGPPGADLQPQQRRGRPGGAAAAPAAAAGDAQGPHPEAGEPGGWSGGWVGRGGLHPSRRLKKRRRAAAAPAFPPSLSPAPAPPPRPAPVRAQEGGARVQD
jgi:hypothetical protein